MTEKRCYRCKQTKPVGEFYRSNVNYYQKECKECCKDRRSQWWRTEAGKRSSANTKLKQRFGITMNEYEKMLAAVNGKCEICGAENSYNGHRLGIDHNHETGKIRGILCKSCNLGISALQENDSIIQSAAQYIMRTYEKVKK
jgi:hypothetical protein